MSTETETGDINVNLKITSRPDGTLISTFLGTRPYLLLQVVEANEDTVDFTLDIGAGVEADVEELASFFDGLADILRSGVTDGVLTTITEADDEDDEIEEGDEDA